MTPSTGGRAAGWIVGFHRAEKWMVREALGRARGQARFECSHSDERPPEWDTHQEKRASHRQPQHTTIPTHHRHLAPRFLQYNSPTGSSPRAFTKLLAISSGYARSRS